MTPLNQSNAATFPQLTPRQWLLWIVTVLFGLYSAFLASAGLAAPWLAANHQLDAASELYAFLSQACNQNPLRSFWLWGYPMGVCTRCIGTYTGAFLAAGIIAFVLLRRSAGLPPPGWAAVALTLGLADKWVGYGALALNFPALHAFMVKSSSGWLLPRTLLGVVLGAGIALTLAHVAQWLVRASHGRTR